MSRCLPKAANDGGFSTECQLVRRGGKGMYFHAVGLTDT